LWFSVNSKKGTLWKERAAQCAMCGIWVKKEEEEEKEKRSVHDV